MQRILGNSYGQLVLENQWKSDSDSNDIFRFCHKDHQHPVPRKLKTADLNGKCFYLRFSLFRQRWQKLLHHSI